MGENMDFFDEASRERLISFTSRLVATKSLTCHEKAAAELVAGEMTALGYDEVTIDEMGNVLGRIGEGPAALMFDAHLDTVGVMDADQWAFDPFGGQIRDGKLCGRGAADTKCPMAAAVYGAYLARKLGLIRGKRVYVSASTMEEDYDGESVKYLLEHTGLRPAKAVICEPTNLRVAVGHRGRSLIEIRAEGVSCHGSTPELGKNPVYMLEEVIRRVRALQDGFSKLPGAHGSVALTNVYCTTASNNSVPGDASIILDRRLALGETEKIIGAEMDRLVAGTETSWHFCDIPAESWQGRQFVFHSFLPAWEIDASHPLVQNAQTAFGAVLGREPELFHMGCSTNGVTTAGVFGIPSIVFGPGDLLYAHARNELCPVDDLVRACAVDAQLCALA